VLKAFIGSLLSALSGLLRPSGFGPDRKARMIHRF
jgi:hypothetical protein